MRLPPDPHYRHRFPAEVIGHAVWLYHVFSLSLRDVKLILAERGVGGIYETILRWCKKFGFRRLPATSSATGRNKWHLESRPDPRCRTLSLACCRSGRRCAGYPCAASARRQRCQVLLHCNMCRSRRGSRGHRPQRTGEQERIDQWQCRTGLIVTTLLCNQTGGTRRANRSGPTVLSSQDERDRRRR